MAKLMIIESPLGGGRFTRAFAEHTDTDVFEGVGYTSESPLEGVQAAHVPLGTPCEGYTHYLLVGEPAFIQKNSKHIAANTVFGAYALPLTQCVDIADTEWVAASRMRSATPSIMSSAALQLAAESKRAPAVVPLWCELPKPDFELSRNEVLGLIYPPWKARVQSVPVVMTDISHMTIMCAALARNKLCKVLFKSSTEITDADRARLERMCGLHAVDMERVALTDSNYAWRACDLYLHLDKATYWPWDVCTALSYRVPVALMRTHVCESLLGEKDQFGLAMPALDVFSENGITGYTSNSADVAEAIKAFSLDPVSALVKSNALLGQLVAVTPRVFVRQLIKVLYGTVHV